MKQKKKVIKIRREVGREEKKGDQLIFCWYLTFELMGQSQKKQNKGGRAVRAEQGYSNGLHGD